MTKIRPIPHVPSPPWIGNALSLSTDAPAFFLRAYRRFGPVFQFQALGKRVITLAGREANLFASKEGAPFFSSKACWKGMNEAYQTPETLISRDGADHKAMRRIQKEGYARARMLDKMPELIAIAQDELRQQQGQVHSVLALFQRVISRQLGFLTMGTQRLDRIEDMCHFLRTTLACTVTSQRPKILLRSPKYKRAQASALRFAHELLEQVDPNAQHLLADVMAVHRQDPERMSKSELLSCALAPFAAGLDTAASTLAFCAYHLSQRPELLQELRCQSDQYFAGVPTVQGLTQSQSAYATVLETLRVNPIAPALSRTAAQSFDFLGYQIPQGAQIILATTVTHHDDRYFPNAARFEIHRYQGPQAQHRQPGAYVPFGVGPHICLGAGMAQALMLLNLKLLVSKFNLSFQGAEKGLQVRRVPTIRPAPSFRVRLSPRALPISAQAPMQARSAA